MEQRSELQRKDIPQSFFLLFLPFGLLKFRNTALVLDWAGFSKKTTYIGTRFVQVRIRNNITVVSYDSHNLLFMRWVE